MSLFQEDRCSSHTLVWFNSTSYVKLRSEPSDSTCVNWLYDQSMNSPPQKRHQIRRHACYCPVCNGQERDDRTIQQHSLVHVCSVSRTGPSAGNLTNMSDSALNPQTSLSHQPELELNPQTSLSHPPKFTLDPSPDLTLSKSDLTTYVQAGTWSFTGRNWRALAKHG